MTDTKRLAFGRQTYPDNVLAVWGARLIWPNDLLYDRQDIVSTDDKAKMQLIAWLNGPNAGDGALKKAREVLAEPYELGIRPDSTNEVVIYEDEHGKIVGSPQGSYGYVYVCAWMHQHA